MESRGPRRRAAGPRVASRRALALCNPAGGYGGSAPAVRAASAHTMWMPCPGSQGYLGAAATPYGWRRGPGPGHRGLV